MIHPLAEAWQRWQVENAGTFDASTLGATQPNYFLGNRLQRAFEAGAAAAGKLAAEAKAKAPRRKGGSSKQRKETR